MKPLNKALHLTARGMTALRGFKVSLAAAAGERGR
jgi:hypothetical protein